MCHHGGLSSRWLLEHLNFPHVFHDKLPAQECMDLPGRDGHDLLRPPSLTFASSMSPELHPVSVYQI